jgi:hypothetical protein
MEDFGRESRDVAQRRGRQRRKMILYRKFENRRTVGCTNNGLDVLHVAYKGKNVFSRGQNWTGTIVRVLEKVEDVCPHSRNVSNCRGFWVHQSVTG